MQITPDEYRLLRHKILPEEISICIDKLCRVTFVVISEVTGVAEKIKFRDTIIKYVSMCDLDKLTKKEIHTLIGLLLKSIKTY